MRIFLQATGEIGDSLWDRKAEVKNTKDMIMGVKTDLGVVKAMVYEIKESVNEINGILKGERPTWAGKENGNGGW